MGSRALHGPGGPAVARPGRAVKLLTKIGPGRVVTGPGGSGPAVEKIL